MNKRQAKIIALEVAYEIITASTGTLEVEEASNDADHARVVKEMERIAASLRNRALRLKLRDRDG